MHTKSETMSVAKISFDAVKAQYVKKIIDSACLA